MKKIFALVLATAMLSSTAFAADYAITGGVGDTTLTVGNVSANVRPNSTVGVPRNLFFKGASSMNIAAGEFNTANFAIATRKFKKGANLVKSVTINDEDEQVVITLNQDLDLRTPKNAANLVIEELGVKAKQKIDASGSFDAVVRSATYNYSAVLKSFNVGYTEAKAPLDNSPLNYSVGTITKFEKGTDGTTTYAVASAENADLYIEGRVYADDKIYVNIGTGIEKEVLKAYPDADLRFAKLTTSGFTSNNTINVLADEDEFVYEIVDKKVVKTNLKWDADTYAWVGKTTGDKYYVISDIELKAIDAPAAGSGTTTTNPETGANDVVGIAAALAVVSLVAAGAVSLKK